VVTRAQAAAALGNVKRLEHFAEHTSGPGGGVTWLQHCTVHFRGGMVQIVFQGTTGSRSTNSGAVKRHLEK
jgi:hypothetical protein